jgi:hypothetical protein
MEEQYETQQYEGVKCQLRSLGALGALVNHIIESKELN